MPGRAGPVCTVRKRRQPLGGSAAEPTVRPHSGRHAGPFALPRRPAASRCVPADWPPGPSSSPPSAAGSWSWPPGGVGGGWRADLLRPALGRSGCSRRLGCGAVSPVRKGSPYSSFGGATVYITTDGDGKKGNPSYGPCTGPLWMAEPPGPSGSLLQLARSREREGGRQAAGLIP